ncbi:hypothetical protein ABMA09_14110 [Erwinia rhapontici]|uniref:hypothetical protein n=1 Tax=Erwinia rhapontici TaxID=55212 RepID=UPI003D36707A
MMAKTQMQLANRAWRIETKVLAGTVAGRKAASSGKSSADGMPRSQSIHASVAKNLTLKTSGMPAGM